VEFDEDPIPRRHGNTNLEGCFTVLHIVPGFLTGPPRGIATGPRNIRGLDPIKVLQEPDDHIRNRGHGHIF
jgi:hypothetical protein